MRPLHIHCLSINEDSPKNREEILDAIHQHLRRNRNITIDGLAFEKRTQKSGEALDDYLVQIKKFARNADLCKHCLEDRLPNKLMSGLIDGETREELLTKEPPPK